MNDINDERFISVPRFSRAWPAVSADSRQAPSERHVTQESVKFEIVHLTSD